MEQMLVMLKIDLGITTGAYDERLRQYIRSSQSAISREGIDLVETDPEDAQLVVMYAAWMWRRRSSMEGMPRMIRYALNNRLFSQKAGES